MVTGRTQKLHEIRPRVLAGVTAGQAASLENMIGDVSGRAPSD